MCLTFEGLLLSGTFLIILSPFSPTKIEELTAGSDEGGAALCFFRLIQLSGILSLSEEKREFN